MEESILKSTKHILGLDDQYTVFDLDVITHINAAFSILSQLGVGPEGGFSIQDDSTLWTDYLIPADQLHLVKTYVYLKVRILFDPPATSYLINAATEQIKEYEWRLNVFREYDKYPPEEVTYLNAARARSSRVSRALRQARDEVGGS